MGKDSTSHIADARMKLAEVTFNLRRQNGCNLYDLQRRALDFQLFGARLGAVISYRGVQSAPGLYLCIYPGEKIFFFHGERVQRLAPGTAEYAAALEYWSLAEAVELRAGEYLQSRQPESFKKGGVA